MPLLTSIVNWFTLKRVQQIDLFRKNPVQVQQDVFAELISAGINTVWGKKYNFSGISSVEDFQKQVPVQSYEEFKPWIDEVRSGKCDVIWPDEIKWFAKSSGTTSDKSKFIPVSNNSLEDCHFRGGRDVLALYLTSNPESKLFKGKGLTLGGSHKIDHDNNQSLYGDLSAILIENLPFWTDFIRTPSQEVALLDKWEEKLEKIARETTRKNVTSIAGVPSWNLVMLKYILEYTGKSNIMDIWPQLELFMHGGVSFVPYREQFQRLIPNTDMNYMETYNASEGFFGIQDEPHKDDMLLMLDYGIFYEFIPLDKLHSSPHPEAHTIENVQTGVNYALIISTNAGLWRYLIGDTVQFTSLYPHKIKITGRTKHFINVFGEEVIIDNAEQALKKACKETGASVTDYTAGPVFMADDKKGGHEWIVEFEKQPNDFELFCYLLDEELQKVNSDYEAKRYKGITLDKPVVHNAPTGTFYKWMDNRGKLGGQNKVPRLSNSRQYLEELTAIIKNTKN